MGRAALAQDGGVVGKLRTIRMVLVTNGVAGPAATYVTAKDQQAVIAGQGVRTGKRSQAEVDFKDGSILRVNERTDLIVENTQALHNVKLASGFVWVRDGRGAHTQVETPSSTAVARGTTFTVQILEDGSTSYDVFDGIVDVEIGGKEIHVGAGQKVTVVSNKGVPPSYSAPDAASDIPANEMPVGYGGGAFPWYLDMVGNLGVGVTAGSDALYGERTSSIGESLQQLSQAASGRIVDSSLFDAFDRRIFFTNAQDTLVTNIRTSGLTESQYLALHSGQTLAQIGLNATQIAALNGIGITTASQAVTALIANGVNVNIATPTGRAALAANRGAYDFSQIKGQPDFDYRLLDRNTTSLAFVGVGGALALAADASHLKFALPTLSGEGFGFYNDPDLIGGRARIDGYISDKTHYALEGNAIRLLTGGNAGWYTKPDSVAVVEQTVGGGVTLFAGRRRFFSGPVFQDEVDSQLIADRYTGTGALYKADGFSAALAYLYDSNPDVSGAQHGALGTINVRAGRGLVGLNYLNVPKVGDSTGITVNGSYPLFDDALEAYAEVGRGPDRASLQTYGSYFPRFYQVTDFDLFVEYGEHEHLGHALSVVVNRDIKKLLSLRGYVSFHGDNDIKAGAAAILKFGTR